jgi:peptidylprolyl isomerase
MWSSSHLCHHRPTRRGRESRAADAKKNPSGLAYKVQTPGTGARNQREQPGDRPLHRMDDRRKDVRQLGRAGSRPRSRSTVSIKGWTEGLQLMVEGEKTRFWIPERWRIRARARRSACSCSTSS